MLSDDGQETDTAERVNIAACFNEFKNTLFNKNVIRHKIKRIQCKKHKHRTCEINKISLSVFDDKRFVFDDGIQALAYFHKDIDSHKRYRLQKILTIKRDSHKKKRFLQMITNKNRCAQIYSR